MSINSFLGIHLLPNQARHLIRVNLLFNLIISFFTHLSSTFLILFVIDNIGIGQAGLTASVMLFTQVVFDYPSGSLGDWIGQKWVLISAYIGHAIAFFLLTISDSFYYFVSVGIIIGFANAQASGAIETWLDNNYQLSIKDQDRDRTIYGYSVSRIDSIGIYPSVVAFIFGGLLATFASRQLVFLIQAVFSLFIIILIYALINDIIPTQINEDIENKLQLQQKKSSYFSFLKGGLKFLFSSRKVFFLIFGLATYDLVLTIWSALLLLPLFFGYAGSDLFTSIMRTIVWILISPIHLYMAGISKRISNDKLSIIIASHTTLLFSGWIFVIFLIPIENSFNIWGLSAVMLIAISVNGTLLALISILRKRVMLEFIPNEIRNSIYSLIPTLVAIMGIPLLPIVGLITELFGLIGGISASLLIALISSLLIFFFFKSATEKSKKELHIVKETPHPAY